MPRGSSSGFGAVLPLFFLSVLPNPLLSAGSGSGKTPLSEAQGCRFFVMVQFRPADALLSPKPGGDQGTLFARHVVQGYVRVCVSYFILSCVLYLLYFFFFRPYISPPRGAVGVATFHPGYLSFPRLTPRHAAGPREVFRMTSPLC